MRILHLLHEPPYPPISGIRCDMWRRLRAFRALGHAVFAVAWASEAAGEIPTLTARSVIEAETEAFVVLPIRRNLATRARRIAHLPRHPSYIASRIPPPDQLEPLIARIRDFAPDLVWLEGVHPSWLGLELKRRLGVPLIYRAHNIEFRYVAQQARLARPIRLKLALSAGTWGLERAERALHDAADYVFDISSDDLAWWHGQGLDKSEWLATQADQAVRATASIPVEARDIDLLFAGSLSSPNNVAGLEWYLDEVHPLLAASDGPMPSLTVAGRRPSSALAARLGTAGARLIADPADMVPLFARARVMLNPILHGSGVNIKTIDMLATGRPVVTTPMGARGLPAEVVAELDVAETPELFAQAIRKRLAQTASVNRQAMLDRVFGKDAVAVALSRVEASLMQKVPA